MKALVKQGYVLKLFWLFLGLVTVQNIRWGANDQLAFRLLYLIAPAVAFGSSVYVVNKFGGAGQRKKVLLSFSVALGLWLCAEVYDVYKYIAVIESFPSITDYFFWAGYAVFAYGLLKEIQVFGIQLSQLSNIVHRAVWLGLMILYGSITYITLHFGYDPSVSWIINASVFSWSIGDMIMGTMAVLLFVMIQNYKTAIVRRQWYWFILATSINLLTDTLYNVFPSAASDGTVLSRILNIVWMSAYFCYAAYFWEILSGITQLTNKHLSLHKE